MVYHSNIHFKDLGLIEGLYREKIYIKYGKKLNNVYSNSLKKIYFNFLKINFKNYKNCKIKLELEKINKLNQYKLKKKKFFNKGI